MNFAQRKGGRHRRRQRRSRPAQSGAADVPQLKESFLRHHIQQVSEDTPPHVHPAMRHAVRLYHAAEQAEGSSPAFGTTSRLGGGSLRHDGMLPPAWARNVDPCVVEQSLLNERSQSFGDVASSSSSSSSNNRQRPQSRVINLPPTSVSYEAHTGARLSSDYAANRIVRLALAQPTAGKSTGCVRGGILARRALVARWAHDAEGTLALLQRTSHTAPVGCPITLPALEEVKSLFDEAVDSRLLPPSALLRARQGQKTAEV